MQNKMNHNHCRRQREKKRGEEDVASHGFSNMRTQTFVRLAFV